MSILETNFMYCAWQRSIQFCLFAFAFALVYMLICTAPTPNSMNEIDILHNVCRANYGAHLKFTYNE